MGMSVLQRASRFFRHDVWVSDVEQLPWPRSALYTTARVLYATARSFLRDESLHRASALSFETVLGLVPFLAFCVSVLKGLGVYDDLIQKTVRPWVMNVTSALGDQGGDQMVTLRSAFFVVLDFVDRADFGSLGSAGLAVLLYITVGMLYSVEASMNRIFAAESARTIARKISDYAAILFITPICLATAAAISTQARRWPWLGGGLVLQLGAVTAMSFGLTMLYVVMPFTRVRLKSAMLGGAVAGLLWYAVLGLHVNFQLGVARYNALYSTFAAIPLFLIWLFTSWIVVLLGAELAAAHQNTATFRYRVLGSDTDPAKRRFLALRAAAEVGRAFVRGEPPLPLRELARMLRVPERLLRRILDSLVAAELLARAAARGQPAYVPARDVDTITVASLLQAAEASTDRALPQIDSSADTQIAELVLELDQAAARSEHNLSLRQLVDAMGDDESARAPAPARHSLPAGATEDELP
jgi:membrane protein